MLALFMRLFGFLCVPLNILVHAEVFFLLELYRPYLFCCRVPLVTPLQAQVCVPPGYSDL